MQQQLGHAIRFAADVSPFCNKFLGNLFIEFPAESLFIGPSLIALLLLHFGCQFYRLNGEHCYTQGGFEYSNNVGKRDESNGMETGLGDSRSTGNSKPQQCNGVIDMKCA